ncbi:MAG: hypothetical protein K0S55_2168 [Clostridia bacterium]|nr:hypothetical protein [Clostridia bacterium]
MALITLTKQSAPQCGLVYKRNHLDYINQAIEILIKRENNMTEEKRKPEIEDAILEQLDGDKQKLALDFVAWLRENKMTLRWAGFKNAWKANYKSKTICYVKLKSNESNEKKWVVYPYLNHINQYEELIVTEDLQNIIWDNMFYCLSCRTPCNTTNITFLGKEIKGVCGGRQPVWFFEPDNATINCIKKLLELEKKARVEA